jgi:hypothetical protein
MLLKFHPVITSKDCEQLRLCSMWIANGTVTRLLHLYTVYGSRNYTALLPQLQRVGRHIIQEKAWEDTNTLSSNRSVAMEMCFPGTFQGQSNPECTYRSLKLIHLNRLYLLYLEPCTIEQSIFPSGHIFYLVSFPKTYCTMHTHTQFTGLLFTSPIYCALYRAIISSLFVFGATAPCGPGPPHSWGF